MVIEDVAHHETLETASMTKISKRVANQPMTIIRGPRCASYQAARRLIQESRIRVAGRCASESGGSLIDDRTHANLPKSLSLDLHNECDPPAYDRRPLHYW